MTEALERIVQYFEEFRESVNRCRSAPSSLDLKSAYGAFGRLRDRYVREKEKGQLTAEELNALAKVFDKDTFTSGMMDFRQVSEHVVKRDGAQIRTTKNAPVQIEVEVSAMPVFASQVVVLPDIAGRLHRIDHLKMLEEAEQRISAALAKAGSSR